MIRLDDIDNKTFNSNISKFEYKTNKNFIEFYEKYLPKLIYYNNNFLKDITKSEDIAMDAFLKSIKKIDDYNPSKSFFSTWLFTISRNECIQYINKNKKFLSSDRVINEDGTSIKDFIEDTLEEDFIDYRLKETNFRKGQILKQKVKELKSPYREVIDLRDIQGKSYRDITIIYRKEQRLTISKDIFTGNSFLNLHDPEKKKPNQLPKFYSIYSIDNHKGEPLKYEITHKDKDNLISQIKVFGDPVSIYGEVPFNMSTLKSQIRNGRIILKNMVKDRFEKLRV